MIPTRRDVRVDGASLSVLEAGPADGEPVVLLHGIPASAELWWQVQPRLAEAGYRVLAPDLPGYGRTRLPADGDRSLAGAARLVAAWLRQEGHAPAWVVGHDLGGGVAQVLAVRAPDVVARLTLGDTVVADSWPVAPIRLLRRIARTGTYPLWCRLGLFPNPWAWAQLRRGFAEGSRLDGTVAAQVFWDDKVRDPDTVREFVGHLRALDPAQTVAVAPGLAEVTVPTQVLWARCDRFQSWETVGRRLVELLPEPEVVLLDDAGHFVPLEAPAAYAEALLAWRRGR